MEKAKEFIAEKAKENVHKEKAAEKVPMKKLCADHMHRYVLVQTKDGYCCDGIVEHVDDEYVCLAVPNCGIGDWDMRAFSPYPFIGTPYVVPPLYSVPVFPAPAVRQAGVSARRAARAVFAALLLRDLLPDTQAPLVIRKARYWTSRLFLV